MKGFKIVALSDKGAAVIRKFLINDRKAIISLSENPVTLHLLWKHRFRPFVREDATKLFITTTFNDNGLTLNIDYKIECL